MFKADIVRKNLRPNLKEFLNKNLTLSSQVALMQGLLKHSSIFISQFCPLQPCSHPHWYPPAYKYRIS